MITFLSVRNLSKSSEMQNESRFIFISEIQYNFEIEF